MKSLEKKVIAVVEKIEKVFGPSKTILSLYGSWNSYRYELLLYNFNEAKIAFKGETLFKGDPTKNKKEYKKFNKAVKHLIKGYRKTEQKKAENSLKHLLAFVGPAPHGGEKVIYHLVKGKWRWWKLDGKPHRTSKRTVKKALKNAEHIKYDEFSIAAHLAAIRKELGLKEYESIQYAGVVIEEDYDGPNLKEVRVDGRSIKSYADAWEILRTTPALIKFWGLV